MSQQPTDTDRDFVAKVELATPCDRTWDSLTGDDRKRYCGDCRLHVHNLSAMTSGEIRELVSTSEGRVCGRFFQRADGTMITKDCAPEREKLQRRGRRLRIAAATLFGLAGTMGLSACGGESGGSGGATTPDNGAVGVDGSGDPVVENPVELMGEVCLPEDELPATVDAPPIEKIGKIAAPAPPQDTPPEKTTPDATQD
jgi:hypothetical protein